MLKKILTVLIALLTANTMWAEPEFTIKKANPLYLKKMPHKPWWNASYKSRVPILVSENIGKKRGRTTLDFVCDFSHKVNSASVRVVTPWEEEIPCQAIQLDDQKIEILFQTSLREYENKPFFIYFDNPMAKQQEVDTDLLMKEKRKGIKICNEKIQVVFTTDNTRSSKIKSLRITGSEIPNQLMEFRTGSTWAGFDLGKIDFSEKPLLKVNGPFKKTLKYLSKDFDVEYSIYSFSPRIDFKLIPKAAKRANEFQGRTRLHQRQK
jgi:hypothetical protein